MSSAAMMPEQVVARLAAPLPEGARQWRQDGAPQEHRGKPVARFVPYIPASVVADRLNEAAPGAWAVELTALQTLDRHDDGEKGIVIGHICAVKARLILYGIAREDIGQGKDYKTAATDAFKRAGMRFGIGRELQSMKGNFVEMDGLGHRARPVEDPEVAWQRKVRGAPVTPVPDRAAAAPDAAPSCPKCGGAGMYDNRASKRNPKAPDFKCSKRGCDGAILAEKAETPSRSRS